MIVGVDEAGRGPLAGPVVAAAVVLCPDGIIGLDDSKKLSAKRRAELEIQIKAWHRESPASLKLAEVPGIGPITATAMVASVGNARDFGNGRQLAAWLGLVPRQHSTGGKSVLLGISKRGDSYLRTLLIHGARSAILAAQRKVSQGTNQDGTWLTGLLQRGNPNIAAVALANKNARIIWALLTQDRPYQANYVRAMKPA